MKRTTILKAALALNVLALASLPMETQAIPYASAVSQSGTDVSFILNEDAHEVKVVLQNPANTLILSTNKGSKNFTLSSPSQTYSIEVTKSTAPGWTQISDPNDLNPALRFYAPRGIAVNKNPGSPHFGRFYVLETVGGAVTVAPLESARTVNEGIYVLNADGTDALAQGDFAYTAGLEAYTFSAASSLSAFKLTVGRGDDNLYIGDFANGTGGLFRMDPTGTTGEIVLDGVGATANPTVHTAISGSPYVEGSLANGDLTVWAIDEQWNNSTEANSLLRWDIGSTALPFASAPTKISSTGISTVGLFCDLDRAEDGNFFSLQYRANNSGAIRVITPDGTTLWNSVDSQATGTDLFMYCRAIAVAGDKMFLMRQNHQVWVVGLTNGPSGMIPDLSQTNLVQALPSRSLTSANSGLEVETDIAGNFYVGSSAVEKVRIFSPGGNFTAITTSEGTFDLVAPSVTVGVTASTPSVSENTGIGVFTLTRTGNTASTLTVNYTITGTAANGSDYAALSGSVTFAVGASSTNVFVAPTNDPTAEATETVILTIDNNPAFSISPASDTVSILDDETPEIQISAIKNQLLEGYAFSTARYRLTRLGNLSPAVTANVNYSGSATLSTDFSGATTVAIGANTSTADLVVSVLGDITYEGNETITASVISGSGYSIGSPASANVTIVDDEFPAGTILLTEEFNSVSDAADWTINQLDSDSSATFGWDYSANAGIPAAPRSPGSSLGVKFTANDSLVAVNGISISPTGFNATGDYRLSFDMWINYNGPMAGGGSGSTYAFNAGVGTTGDHVNWPNGFSDGGWFSVMGDGGNGTVSGDYNAYAAFTLFNESTGVYAAGTATSTRDHNDPYYSIWGGNPAPAAQLLIDAGQTGNTFVGVVGMAWHTVSINKQGEVVTWTIDGIPVASITNDVNTPFTTTGNIFIGYSDQYSGVSGNPAMSFGIVDNLRVETFVDAPPPAPVIGFSRSGNSVTLTWTGDYTLQEASVLTGSPSDWSNVAGNPGSGHVVNAASGIKFYRLTSE